MDVRFAMPVYRDGKIFCWLSNTGHWPDIGGAVPGGFSASATAVEQEGLRLPPVKLFKKGVLDPRDLRHHLLQHPRRRPAHRRHQGAGRGAAGRRRTGSCAILDRYGDETVVEAIAELRRRAAEQMRANIAADPRRHLSLARPSSIPTAWSNEPLTIALAVEKQGDTLTFDFAGSSASPAPGR